MVGVLDPLCTVYRVSPTVGLVYINLQLEYELRTWTRFGQFRKLKQLELGAPSSQPP